MSQSWKTLANEAIAYLATLTTGAALASNQASQITAEQAIQVATEALAALISGGKLPVSGTLTGVISSAVCTDDGPEWEVLGPTIGYSADASSTALDVATPTSGKKLIIDDLHIGVTTTCIVSLYEESNATAKWSIPLAANSPYVLTTRDLLRLPTSSKKLQLKTNIAAPVYTNCLYHEV